VEPRVHRSEVLDDRVGFGERHRSGRQDDVHHRRQRLGNGGDCQGNGTDEQDVPGLAASQSGREHDEHGDPGGRSDPQRHRVDLPIQRRLLNLRLGQHLGDLAHLAGGAGLGHDDDATAVGDGRVHEGDVRLVARPQIAPAESLSALGRRNALSRQRGLIDLQGTGGHDPPVRRDLITGGDQDDIAGYDLIGGDRGLAAVSAYPR